MRVIVIIACVFLSLNTKSQIIQTVAGGGAGGGSDGWGSGLSATNAILGNFSGIICDSIGNLFIADKDHHIVRKVDVTTNVITTIAGTGLAGYNGDNIVATSAYLNYPGWIAFDTVGNLLISDRANYRVRKVSQSGIISTIAGNGNMGYGGDGNLAVTASINAQGICSDRFGNLFIADNGNNRIRKVDINGIISTIAGNGNSGYSGDGGLAVIAELESAYGISTDSFGNIVFADWDNNRVRRIDKSSGIISTVSGNGIFSYNGDSQIATTAGIDPSDMVIGKNNEIYLADYSNNRIRKIDANGMIFTIAGNGMQGFSGDGGNADTAKLFRPAGVCLDYCGNLYIADNQNKRVRKITSSDSCSATSLRSVKSRDQLINVFPNPATSQIVVASNVKLREIYISNTTGRIIHRQQLNSRTTEIGTQYFQPGVYFITTIDATGCRQTQKLIKE